MKLFKWGKDGGKDSTVDGFFLVEIKPLFSIVLLHFQNGTREVFHSHAFNAITWILKGKFIEHNLNGKDTEFGRSLKPKITPRSCFHKVESVGDTWALTFRGPWVDKWKEFLPATREFVTLTHGRKVIERKPA